MQRNRQLLALATRLQQAAAAGNVCLAAASRPGAWELALQPLPSLRRWASSSSACRASHTAVAEQLASVGRTAAARAGAAASGVRRGLASDAAAVSRPRPAPRGISKAGSGRSLWSGLFLLAPGALAAFLGKWQWERRQWKQALLDRRQEMMEAPPLDLFGQEEQPAEYVRVAVEGVFDHGASQYVGPRTRQVAGTSKQGFLLMTPLRQESGGRAVMVNRGWVPAEWRQSEDMRRSGQPGGKVRLEGILRHSEDAGTFVPPNEPGRGNWYYINTAELAAAAGLPPQAPLVEVVTEEPGGYIGRGPPTPMDVLGGRGRMPQVEESYPLPKSREDLMHFSVMPQDHFNYAATWWTLSAATLALAVKAVRQGIRAA